MSTAPKKKKVVKKKVVKKVIKKKVKKQPPIYNGHSPKINYNVHTKVSWRTYGPSVEGKYELEDDDYNECILDPNNDRRIIICDSENKCDGIVQCIGSIESQYIPDPKTKKIEKTHGTGTVIHIDDTNNIYVLSAAHNILVAEKQCEICKTKTLKTYCPNNQCNSKHKAKKTGNLIKPTHIYFTRRGHDKNTLGESIQRYQIEDYKLPEEYNKFATPRGGYDICILIFKCHDKSGIDLYKQHCSNISLINDEQFGGDKCILHIYGYPGEKRKEKDYRVYYYLFGMGTSKLDVKNNFSVARNDDTDKLYVVNKGIDTTAGQSGSCIYSYYGNDVTRYLLYGVHSGGSQKQQANLGTFFDIDTIEWMANILETNVTSNKFIVCHYTLVINKRRKQQLAKEKSKLSELERLKDSFNEIKHLQKHIIIYKQENSQIPEYIKTIDEWKNKCNSLYIALEANNNEDNNYKTIVDKLSEENKAYEDTHRVLRIKIEKQDEDHENKETESQLTIQFLRDERKKLKQQINENEDAIKNLADSLDSANEKKTNYQMRYKILNEKYMNLKKQITNTQQVQGLSQQNKQLQEINKTSMSIAPKKKKVVKKKVVRKVIKKKVKKQPPKPKSAPSIEDAISRFTQLIEEQTKIIEKLKQENQKLNNEIEQLKNKSKPNDNGGVATDIFKDDAKNILAELFGPNKPMTTTKTILSANEAMPRNNDDDDDEKGVNLEIRTPPHLVKYVKLKKIMPVHIIAKRMKMDGISKMLIGQLTKQWMKATIPDGTYFTDKNVAPPPPMAKEFSDLIEKKDNDLHIDDNFHDKLRALGLKPKKKVIPSRKMKRFQWKKIASELIPPTIWKDIDDEIIVYNKIEFELKFQCHTPRPTQKKKNIKDRTGQVYTFVLPKRSQNIQIALSRFKMSDQKLKAAVVEMDEIVFDIKSLEQFINIAPDEYEQRETAMHANKEDVDPKYFGTSEKFFYEFVDIVDLSLRLDLWLFMMNFKEMVTDKQSQIYKLQIGIKSLTESVAFKNILTLLLAWGNHMNGGSHAGQAFGFEIDSLGLVSKIKSMDQAMNMMMYLYKTLYERYPKHLDVMTQLKAIKVCTTMETQFLDKSITGIKEKFELLQSTLTRFEEDYVEVLPVEDKFIKYTTNWIKKNKKHLTKLVMMHKRTKHKCQQLSALFSWDLEQNPIETLFSICNTFVADLYKARDDIHKLEIEREIRRRKRKKKQQIANYKKQHKKKFENIQKPNKRSIMDDVRNRKRKNRAILKKLAGKLDKSLVEKSKLIEATNYKTQLPEEFKKNKVKRKNAVVEKSKLIEATNYKKQLPEEFNNNQVKGSNAHTKRQNKIQVTKRKQLKRNYGKRKRTKGWFAKGKEPKVNPQMNLKSIYYNPLSNYEKNYKNAYRRGGSTSNNKEDDDMKFAIPTTQTRKQDLKKGVGVAKSWNNAHHPALKNSNKYDRPMGHKRAQSGMTTMNRLNRAYSPPNMGIVRLNKLGINNGRNMKKTKKKSGVDINIARNLVDGNDEFLLLDSPAASPEPRRSSGQYEFTEENNWD